eukprot:jgi/Phyca11/102147/e_gw1.6.872.1
MESSQRCAEAARVKEQERQARYYNRRVRKKKELRAGDRVWMFRPPRGAEASKFVHQWVGPMRVVEPVGYDNWLVKREDVDGESEKHIAHVSFLISYHKPIDLLKRAALDLERQLEYEDTGKGMSEGEAAAKVVRAAEVPTTTPASSRVRKRDRQTARGAAAWRDSSDILVEARRRKRRNRAGMYVLEHELRTRRALETTGTKQSGGEFQPVTTTSCCETTESWKTLVWRKACNMRKLLRRTDMVTRVTRSESALDGGDCEDYLEEGIEVPRGGTWTRGGAGD